MAGKAKVNFKVEGKKTKIDLSDLKKKKSGLVEVGILSGTGLHPLSNSATFAEIMFWLEYGTEKTNEYAPMRRWLNDKKDEYKALIKKWIRLYLLGELKLAKIQTLLGTMGQADLRNQMKLMTEPANEESTQRKKGRKTGKSGVKENNPTIDTGLTRKAISWKKI